MGNILLCPEIQKIARLLSVVVAIWCMANRGFSQSPSDSLLQTFASIENDSARVDSMVNVAFKLAFNDAPLALEVGKEAAQQAQEFGLDNLRVKALLTIGSTYHNQGIRDWAIDFFLQAMNFADSVGWIQGRAAAWNNIGSIQAEEEHYEDALKSLRYARRDFLAIGSAFNASAALMNIGSVYLSLHQLDAAKGATDSTLEEMKVLDDPQGLGIIMSNLGQIYAEQKRYPEALESMDQAIAKAIESEDMYGLGEYYISRGSIRVEAMQLGGATEDVQRGIQMMQDFGAMELVARGYGVMSRIAKAEGKPMEALEWLEKRNNLNDSLQSDERETALANFQSLYEVERKDAEIDLLSKDKEVQDANILKTRYLVALLLMLLVAMVVIVLLMARSNRLQHQKNAQIMAQHAQIATQNEALRAQNEQLDSLNHEMEGMVHVVAHDLKAPLSQVGGLLDGILEAGELNPQQGKMAQLARRVTQNASNLVKDLVESASIEQQAQPSARQPVVVAALMQEIVLAFGPDAQRKSIEILLDLPDGELICQSDPASLRRILENLLSNALKFSVPGKTVQMALMQQGQSLKISIQDQGPGISPADQKNLYRKFHKLSARPTGGESSSGLGLAIVKTLVEQLGGEIALTSEVGVGATFVVTIPC